MQIKKISISNFRSIKNIEVHLDKFNVLIGPNAAGKSNFINIFKFIKDIAFYGLENAISLQGGADYIRNFNLSSENALKLNIVFNPKKDFKFEYSKDNIQYFLNIFEFEYRFSLRFNHSEYDYTIIEDSLIQKFDVSSVSNGMIDAELIGKSQFQIDLNQGKFALKYKKNKNINLSLNDYQNIFLFNPENFFEKQKFLSKEKLHNTLLLETPLYFMPYFEVIKKDFASISIYDFDPSQPKYATSLTGKSELEENGENLAIVIKKILNDASQSRKLFNLISDVLPFIEDLNVEKFLDKYLQIVIKEKYSLGRSVPGFILSDGTIFLLSIIIALYFENKPVAIFEEPERRIHPYLISKLIDMMKDASNRKQIILSTHNPEIVKYAGISNLMFVTRDNEGFSFIQRLHEKKDIMMFLKNEIGIEELYIQNLLD